jgi:hypothetical protein
MNALIRQLTPLILLLATAAPTLAQWAWRDARGQMVYSDRAPPAEVKPEQIVKQPRAAEAVPPAPGSAPAPAAGATTVPARQKSAAELEMEFRQRQQQRAEAEKKTQEQQATNQQRNAECERARGYLMALERGERVFRLNAKGEREYLEDAQRNADIQRLRQQMAASCK